MRSGSPASTDVDVEHGREASKTEAAQRRCPRQRARDIYATLYLHSHSIPATSTEPRSGERRRQAAQRAHNLYEYYMRTTYTSTTPATPATICRIDLLLAS